MRQVDQQVFIYPDDPVTSESVEYGFHRWVLEPNEPTSPPASSSGVAMLVFMESERYVLIPYTPLNLTVMDLVPLADELTRTTGVTYFVFSVPRNFT